MPATPSPPSLNLPSLVKDLSATRAGDVVTLTWTLPQRNTDHLLLKGNLDVIVCRKLPSGECHPVEELSLLPGSGSSDGRGPEGLATIPLPPDLVTGEARPIRYSVQLRNKSGRAAGLSNEAIVLAGQAPSAVQGLAAEVTRQGVALKWSAAEATHTSVRLVRIHLLTPTGDAPQTRQKDAKNPLGSLPVPTKLSLLVEPDKGRALDTSVRIEKSDQSYEYRAERVVRQTVEGQVPVEILELTSPLSTPVAVVVKNIYAPDRPAGLAAVATNTEPSGIDLSWQPSLATGLTGPVAGYVVYRREGEAPWARISGSELVVGPAFHDAQVQAEASYKYAVSAVGANGHESARSEEAEEKAPQK